jgi:hypothetical protein
MFPPAAASLLTFSVSQTRDDQEAFRRSASDIFRHYLDTSPQSWPRLVHICRTWQRIVWASRQSLHLQLFCTHGTPVFENQDYWLSLPIAVKYGESLADYPPTLSDEDNIMAALKQSDRVTSITLIAPGKAIRRFRSWKTSSFFLVIAFR